MNILIFFLITATTYGAMVSTREASEEISNEVFESLDELPEEEPVITAPPDAPVTAHGGTADAPLTTPGLVAEEQTPTGQFTTATEVKPILSMTKQSWVAVREYDGKDLVYFTNLLAWRCGVAQITYQINDGPETVFDAEPCQLDYATPNAMVDIENFLPYIEAPLKSVESVRVHVVYDDLSEDEITVSRKEVLMP